MLKDIRQSCSPYNVQWMIADNMLYPFVSVPLTSQLE